MAIQHVRVPNIGDYNKVDIIEINVKIGDRISEEESLITLETDKASMEVPSPIAGIVRNIYVNVGDKVSKDSLVLSVETDAQLISKQQEYTNTEPSIIDIFEIKVPDIGDYKDVDVIEIHVNIGDKVSIEDSLITLETDKASMEVPSPKNGTVSDIKVKVGDKVSEHDLVLTLNISDSTSISSGESVPKNQAIDENDSYIIKNEEKNTAVYASPAVRRTARTLGIDLLSIFPTGRKGRITKEDCESYIKKSQHKPSLNLNQLCLSPDPEVDHAKFGEIEVVSLSRINKISAKNLSRNWVRIPHVTFYENADITDLEAFRISKKTIAKRMNIKLTALSFLIKALSIVLKEYPRFNSSLCNDGDNIIIKKYFNIGCAVDTSQGLVVPVIKNVDQKSIFEIAREIMHLVTKAQNNKLNLSDMQGATFTISSLGALGTTAFTPIINMPEVAIIGISKSEIKPIWNGKEFIPRTILPLSLSTDHRVIDGMLAVQFLTRYCSILADLKEALL